MKIIQKKSISLPVSLAVCLFLVLQVAAPATDEGHSARGNHSQSVSSASGEEAPRAMEKEADFPKVRNKNILKWVLIGAAVVGAGVLVYLLTKKKTEYTLTVSLGEGVEGSPASGTHKYKKGEKVTYSYTLSNSGYKDLSVTLDGAAAGSSGSFTMDRDRSLNVVSTRTVSVSLNSTPAGASIYDNGADTGKVTPALIEYPQGGTHQYLLRLCGYADFPATVEAAAGRPQAVNAVLSEGISDDFEVDLAPCWKQSDPPRWSVSEGLLRGTAYTGFINSITYNHAFDNPNTTITARLQYFGGEYSFFGLLLAESNNERNQTGYGFVFYNDGSYRMVGFADYNLPEDRPASWPYWDFFDLPPYGEWSQYIKGRGEWNTVKVIRSGPNYNLYINDVELNGFTHGRFNPKYTVIFFGDIYDIELRVDWVRQALNTGAPASIRKASQAAAPKPGHGFLKRNQ